MSSMRPVHVWLLIDIIDGVYDDMHFSGRNLILR